jgi:hypothetical protein
MGKNKRIEDHHGANIKIVEIPPGPPVIATLVAEIHGESGRPYEELARAGKMVGR